MFLRKFFISIMLLASVAAMSLAQGTASLALSETMGKFLDACLPANPGMARKDADMTPKAIDALTSLNMASLSESRLAPVDGSDMLPLDGHLVYDAHYLDSLIVCQFETGVVKVNPAMLLRGDDMPDICYANKVLRPHGKVTFQCKGSGTKELVVVAEGNAEVSMMVDDEKNDIHIAGAKSHGVGTAYARWKMPRFSTFLVTVENKTDAAVSFVLAINQ